MQAENHEIYLGHMKDLRSHIPTALYDKVSEELLRDGCCSIWVHLLHCVDEMRSSWEEGKGKNLAWIPGHFEKLSEVNLND